jgi:hypothetical protein
MVTESRLEEAISAGMVVNLHGQYTADAPRVKDIVKFSIQDSAPSRHGLTVEFESGERFEILIQRKA